MANAYSVLLLFCSLLSLAVNAEPSVEVSASKGLDSDLRPSARVTEQGPDSRLSQVLNLPDSAWHPANDYSFVDMGTDGLWFNFSLYADEPGSFNRILAFNNPSMDRLEVYHYVNGRLKRQLTLGDTQPFGHRSILSTDFLYAFDIRQQEQHQFWLKLTTAGSSYLPIHLWEPYALLQSHETRNMLNGIQLGALAAIGLFALFIAVTTRSFSYSYYAGYVLTMTLLVACINGTAFRYLWPNVPQLQRYVIPLLVPLVIAFGILFTEKVLQLKYHSIRMLRACRYTAACAILLMFATVLIDYALAIYIEIISVMSVSLMLLIFSILQAVRGNKLAKLYTVSWSGMTLGIFVSCLMYLGLIKLPLMPQTPVLLGLTFEVVFMAAVLAIRYNDERKAKQRIQQEALKQAERIREAREETLRMEAESNEKLERMVQERTLELEIALRELNEANQKLTEQATIDSLTGVKNRSTFDKRLQAEGRISRRQQTPLALLMLDIDRFKTINDKHGHLAGDQTLKSIADTLKNILRRPSDLVSRFGGEEFAIILPNTDTSGALRVAEQIRHAISALDVSWDKQTIPLTASIGVSVAIIESDMHITQLLEQADKALYRAKNSGRDRVYAFDPEQDTLSDPARSPK
ncbi:sensor domain-containing diguanylate cyclase [Shewanella algae]|uniref:sensor domain-containing diguanylate cyclase n=1 Tax=Shewanella algae TaxID=38313 RepID=UPI00118371D1|nr:diguanylate cyclase [Shewanella algae]TVP07680.1 deoxynucleoside kinase [Shewanella algae]BCV42494.1 deoxynucleoside kinase [Shewanella algae]